MAEATNTNQSVIEDSFPKKTVQFIKNIGNNMGKAVDTVSTEPRPYMSPYLGGVMVGIVLFVAFFVMGKGLGGSGAYTRIVAVSMNTLFPVHTEGLSYFQKYLTTTAGALDNWLVYLMIGTFIGALLSGILGRRMKTEIFKGPNATKRSRLLAAFGGGILVAIGARLAGGCTSGLALTGGAVFGVAGWVFFLAVFAGGFAMAYFVRKLWL